MNKHENSLEHYRAIPSPMPVILMFAFIFMAILFAALQWCSSLFPQGLFPLEPREKIGRIIFLAYSMIFAAIWVTYYSSKSERFSFLRRRSLRVLLSYTSENWRSIEQRVSLPTPCEPLLLKTNSMTEDEANIGMIEDHFRDKARSAMQNLGMLMAIACLELAQISLISRSISNADGWSKLTLGCASLASISALIMFLIATDSLDTIFNRFQTPSERHKLIDHFYRKSINPRYYGLTLIILSATMLIGSREPVLGAMAFGIIFSVGYSHWFPFISLSEEERENNARRVIGIVLRVVIISFPIIFSTICV